MYCLCLHEQQATLIINSYVVLPSDYLSRLYSRAAGSSLYAAKIPSTGEKRSSSKHNRFPGSKKTSTNYNPCELCNNIPIINSGVSWEVGGAKKARQVEYKYVSLVTIL